MVRLMMGTLWSIGQGKVTIAQLVESLSGVSDEKLGVTAPAEGLYLKEVIYDK